MARTLKARALGAALRREREQHGLTTRALAELIQRNHGEVSRWETGDRTPRPEQVAQILTAMGINGQPYEEIISLAYDTDAPSWEATTLPEQRQQLAALVDYEQQASRIVEVSPLLVPGLLQTNEYIQLIMAGARVPADEVPVRVAVRKGRRDTITGPDPRPFVALIREGVLHHTLGRRAMMIEQLRYLIEMARRPNVDLRIVPFEAEWAPDLEGLFTLLDLNDGVSLVLIENRRSALFLHQARDVELYREAVVMVTEQALSPDDSIALIGKRIKELEKTA